MKESRSEFHDINGLRQHVRLWGNPQAPKLFLLHGWMDVSASFQFLVDALQGDWHVIAPDWRGFGLSEWNRGSYYFPDYLADLDALLDLYTPDEPADLVGHSMGGNIAGLYAGVRPYRVRTLVCVEGFGLEDSRPEEAPARYEQWLDELAQPQGFRPYTSFDGVEKRLTDNNSRMSHEQAEFLARHWARQTEEGEVMLNFDHRHKMVNPVLYRLEEALACWSEVTAPTLWVVGSEYDFQKKFHETPEAFDRRKAAFRDFSEVRIEDAGHMIHHDQPRELARAVEAFLRVKGGL